MTDIGRWIEAWRELGVGDSPALRRLHGDLLGHCSEPHRRYHTQHHLAECFETVHTIISLLKHSLENLDGPGTPVV
jgi:predicted metal-dependent HD superfamily phosphohydrolase